MSIKNRVDRATWEKWIKQVRLYLIGKASERKFCTYTELVTQLSLPIDPHTELGYLLGDVCRERWADNKSLLTVLVIHKNGDALPGKGFFELVEELTGKKEDMLTVWAREMNRVMREVGGR